MKHWSSYTTKDGQIGELKPYGIDLGDGFQRSGFKALCDILEALTIGSNGDLEQARDKWVARTKILEVRPAIFWRGVDGSGEWYEQDHNITRDQLTSNIIVAGIFSEKLDCQFSKDFLSRVTKGMIERWGRYDNSVNPDGSYNSPDFVDLDDVGFFLRAHNKWWARPILWITDSYMYLGTLFKAFMYSREHMDKADIDNRLTILIQSILQKPTLISRLAVYTYAWNVKVWPEFYDLIRNHKDWKPSYTLQPPPPTDFGIQYALDRKYGKDSAPPYNEALRRAILKLFKGS